MAKKKQASIMQVAINMALAAAAGAATGTVIGFAGDLVGDEYAAPAVLLGAGAAAYFWDNPTVQAAAYGVAGVAGERTAATLLASDQPVGAIRTGARKMRTA